MAEDPTAAGLRDLFHKKGVSETTQKLCYELCCALSACREKEEQEERERNKLQLETGK